jgi:hypothetical protein
MSPAVINQASVWRPLTFARNKIRREPPGHTEAAFLQQKPGLCAPRVWGLYPVFYSKLFTMSLLGTYKISFWHICRCPGVSCPASIP